jgi:hypothetical protein
MCTNTYSLQVSLIGRANHLSNAINEILQSLRNKFLLRGDWNKDLANFEVQVNSIVEALLSDAKQALSDAEKEQQSRDAFVLKISTAIYPLKCMIDTNESFKNKIQSLPKNVLQDSLSTLLDVGGILLNTILQHLLYSKDHCTSEIKETLPSLLTISSKIHQEFQNSFKIIEDILTTKRKDYNSLLIDILSRLNDLTNEYYKQFFEVQLGEFSIKDALSSFRSLSKAFTETLKNRNQTRLSALSGDRKDKVIHLLNLESAVIKSRILFAKSEKIVANLQ